MDLNSYISKNITWNKLPSNVKSHVGDLNEYAKKIKEFSIVNQLRYKDNLIRFVEKNQRAYYEQLLHYSREHYMLFPYHLSDYIISGMRITPFQYYQAILIQMVEQEKNYDTLPNFTAADCVRLLGIGRNQYIDLMNQYKSSKKFLGMIKKPIKDLLPSKPVSILFIDFWWTIRPGYITEDDIKQMVTAEEKVIIDTILNDTKKSFSAGQFNYNDVLNLYIKGLIYFDIIIEDNDLIYIPPLEGFVMNRTTGDYFETLLYKIFVSIDEKTTVLELSNVLQIDLDLVKNTISMYCRLGFAHKKNNERNTNNCNITWLKKLPLDKNPTELKENIAYFINSLNSDEDDKSMASLTVSFDGDTSHHYQKELSVESSCSIISSNSSNTKRIGLLYDSTLAAFLMMGNLTPGLKSHAVTMFEVGKLSDESMDSFISELCKINGPTMEDEGGEAERYFRHAIILCQTIQFLRNNLELTKNLIDLENDSGSQGLGLDLIRCESLLNLDQESCERLLSRNYELLISVAPLSNETQIIKTDLIPYFGASSLVNSIWFKLFLYSMTNCGPQSLLLSKGVRLTSLPSMFFNYDAIMLTPWGRDSNIVSIHNSLLTINDSSIYNPLLIQAYPSNNMKIAEDELVYLPLPLLDDLSQDEHFQTFSGHPAITNLLKHINLHRVCGYITLIKYKRVYKSNLDMNMTKNWFIFDCHFGIPLFDRNLNQSVCNRIRANRLFEREKLKEVVDFNKKLFHDMGNFINNFVDIQNVACRIGQNQIPSPSTCVLFNNGDISKWQV